MSESRVAKSDVGAGCDGLQPAFAFSSSSLQQRRDHEVPAGEVSPADALRAREVVGATRPKVFQPAQHRVGHAQVILISLQKPASDGCRRGVAEAAGVVSDAIEIECGDRVQHLDYRWPISSPANQRRPGRRPMCQCGGPSVDLKLYLLKLYPND
jgi:hypothetical protein